MFVVLQIADVPCEFVSHFDPAYPLILGGLLNSEEAVGYVQVNTSHFKSLFVAKKVFPFTILHHKFYCTNVLGTKFDPNTA